MNMNMNMNIDIDIDIDKDKYIDIVKTPSKLISARSHSYLYLDPLSQI